MNPASLLQRLHSGISAICGSLKTPWCGKVRHGLGAVAVAVLAGCAATEEAGPGGPQGSYGPGYPPGSAAWSKGAKAAFRDSFMAGMADRREGFRYDEDRGAVQLDMDERYFYRLGYRRGYYHEDTVRPGAEPSRPEAAPAPVSPDHSAAE